MFLILGATEKSSTPKMSELNDNKLGNAVTTKKSYVDLEAKKSKKSYPGSGFVLALISRLQKFQLYLGSQKTYYKGKLLKPDYIANFFRFISLAMIPMAAMAPSAVALYWAASGMSAVAVNLTLLSPKVQNLVRIPRPAGSSDTPYRDVLNNMKDRTDKTLAKLKNMFSKIF